MKKNSILSITFHIPEKKNKEWNVFEQNSFKQLLDNLMDVDDYIISEVESDMIKEGKNINLLLFFSDLQFRTEFLESELLNLQEIIEQKFQKEVMIFVTKLNSIL